MPMQFFILFIGAMVFVFYIYEKPPVLFERTEMRRIEAPSSRPLTGGGGGDTTQAFDSAGRRRTA